MTFGRDSAETHAVYMRQVLLLVWYMRKVLSHMKLMGLGRATPRCATCTRHFTVVSLTRKTWRPPPPTPPPIALCFSLSTCLPLGETHSKYVEKIREKSGKISVNK